MPRRTMATKFGAIGEGDLLVVEDWGYTPEIWVVEQIDPAGPDGCRIHGAVMTPDTFESRALGTRDVLQSTLEKQDIAKVKMVRRGLID